MPERSSEAEWLTPFAGRKRLEFNNLFSSLAQSVHRSLPNGDKQMLTTFRKLIKDESGATAIEYGLIAALVAVVLITALTNLGSALDNKFDAVTNALNKS